LGDENEKYNKSNCNAFWCEYCNKEILAGLGAMYVSDARITKNIDKYADGLAEFLNKAIDDYCK
jgi:hypothetical protein